MWQRILADLIVLLHFAFILFALFGGLLVLRRRGWVWFHLPAAAWAALIEFAGWICPLTPLENRLRAQGGGSGYGTGFVEHYILPLVYPAGLTRQIQIILGLLVLLLNLVIYAIVIRRAVRARRPTDQPPSSPSGS
jgi:hypothetical protein